MNEVKIVIQSTRQREKTMTGAKSRFKIIYENILDDFGCLLSKERILIENRTRNNRREIDGRKRKKMGLEMRTGGIN